MNIELFSLQSLNRDITKQSGASALPSYRPGGHNYDLAREIGWESIVWAWLPSDYSSQRQQTKQFIAMANNLDEINPYGSSGERFSLHRRLWVLSVPSDLVRYAGRSYQAGIGNNIVSSKRSLYETPESCRLAGNVPECLVKFPLKDEWVLRTETVSDFIAVGPCKLLGVDPLWILDSSYKWNKEHAAA